MTYVTYLNYSLLSCMQMILVYLCTFLLKSLILNYNYYLHGSNQTNCHLILLNHIMLSSIELELNYPNSSIKIKTDEANIMEVQCIKYLGVILDNKLSWISTYKVTSKVKFPKGIGIMYKARNYINKKALLGLYHSYIYILTLYIALNLGATHPIVTLILYLCYRNVFLESLPFLIMMFHLNYYLGILIFCP